ncbi:MAG: hypothetical protein HYU66_01680 [Armatimonadetes bacterium]|nr:hypothetical protein [Armatimonadota bacterium]
MAPAAPAAPGKAYVWWEGERTTRTNFPRQTWFSPGTFPDTRDQLSAGDWLSCEGKRTGDEAFATYDVDVPRAGAYNLWTRKFWHHGPFRWRFDQQDWQTCGRDCALADDTPLKQFVNANWVYLGKVDLTAGTHPFELRLLAAVGEEQTACFDCFLLIPGPFKPSGRVKPDERSGKAEPGCFAWEPALDAFGGDAVLDLRSLNEAVAGERGTVRCDGGRFALGDGRPVRFWAVNCGYNLVEQDHDSVDYLARKLAKLGVNMVRVHGAVFREGGGGFAADPARLDKLCYFLTALKKQGIYTFVSYYFPLWFNVRPEFGLEGYDQIQNKVPFALLFFNPRMQQIHRDWTRAILTHPNPYSGVTLAKEPALAILEIQNEDSFFFWTFNRQMLPPAQWLMLEKLYGGWLAKRFGSLQQALAQWPGARLQDDDPAAGVAGIYDAWHMTRDGMKAGAPDKVRRIGEQVRFLAELQRQFYLDSIHLIRDDLGATCLVSPGNWQVTDPSMLDALERYTYAAGDVIDRHGYFGGEHKGDGAGYAVRVGQTWQDLCGLTVPERLPLQFAQYTDRPHIISEIGWTNPNRFRADGCFLGSAYGALQGVDGFFWFAVGSSFLADTSISKFPVGCPTVAGAFPAAALQYRRGDVREGEPVIDQVLKLDDLFAMRGSGIGTPAALDDLRAADVPPGGTVGGAVTGFDPLSFYAGPVLRRLGDDPAQSKRRDLSRLIDRNAKVVRSVTGELAWDWGRGLATVDTPRSQGAAGNLRQAGAIELSTIGIDCTNDYAAIQAITLDDRPLAESRRILVQAVTEEQPYGWRADAGRITSLGAAPWSVRKVAATLRFRLTGGGTASAQALDENGYATGRAAEVRSAGGVTSVKLPEDALYSVVERR